MASAPLNIGLAKSCFIANNKRRMVLAVVPGAVTAKNDLTLPFALDLRTPCPINSITHINFTSSAVTRHNLIGSGTASDQITYAASAAHDTTGQFDIKSKTVIRLNEATEAASILLIDAMWDI